MHILLGSLEFGSQVVETFFPCAGLHVVGCGGIEVLVCWHTITYGEPCVLFECKEGLCLTHEEEGILEMSDGRGKK